MAEKLLPVGYDVFTIDIQWYEPAAQSYTYNAKPIPTMDGFGRVTRRSIASFGRQWRWLQGHGDKVHALGLKFAIHIMRGIPRLAGGTEPARARHRYPRRRHCRHDQHLLVESGHVWRRHEQARRAGLLRLHLCPLRLLGRRLHQDGRHEPAL